MKQLEINKISEKGIYLIFWIFVFIFPVLLSPGRGGTDWGRVLHEFMKIFPFFIIFLVNNFILFGLLKKKKYLSYIIVATTVIILFSLLGSYNRVIFDVFNLPPPQQFPGNQDMLWVLNNVFYNFILSILVIGLNNAIKITISWLEERSNYEKLQKENLKNQLSILQHQISPHFFMNTLNNIHSLIDYDQEIAKKSVVKLSKLMRVLLYDNENYSLQKEIDFIKDYIELMKIRVTKDVEILFTYPENVSPNKFPPLLFINLVENSFKHGILPYGKSFIHIFFELENENLHVRIINSKINMIIIQNASVNNKIGIENTRKRFDLIYDRQYVFEINETDSIYEVNIVVPTTINS